MILLLIVLVINVPETAQLKRSILVLNESLKLSSDKLREIEHNTRDQHLSDVWVFCLSLSFNSL